MPFMQKHMSRYMASTFYLVRISSFINIVAKTDLIESDVLLVNQTADTLQNLCLDFSTLGDLKLVERPAVHTLAPHSFHSIKATIKVSRHLI